MPDPQVGDWYHLNGTVCIAGHDAETDLCMEGHGPIMARLIWLEVQRLRGELSAYKTALDTIETRAASALNAGVQIRTTADA
jgi:hypothetical protein